MTRKWITCISLLLALLTGGCAKQEEAEKALDFNAASAAQATPAQEGQSPANSSARPVTPGTGKLKLTDSVCYAFPGMLYGAVAYTNTDDAAIMLTEAYFAFTYDGGSQQSTFRPVTADYEAVQPGETAWCTLWLPVDDTAGAPQNIKLDAQLSASRTDVQQQTLVVSQARLIQNYPGFATLSGELANPGTQTCDLNLVYVGFYDKDEAFLGSWHFTQNAVLQPGDSAAFVVHLQSLPIQGLSEQTAEMRFRAFDI